MDGSSGIPPTPFRFNNEELRALQECNSESFFYRSLPFSVIMGVGTHLGVKNGYLSATRYGSAPKVALALVAGYILGKISYQAKCAEKIMALPESKLGAMLRERRRGKYTDSLTMDQPDIGKIFGDTPPSDVYSDLRTPESAPSHMDIDTERHQDMDSGYWNSTAENRPGDDSFQPAQGRTITSYDELRRKNREEYDASRTRYQRPAGRPEDVDPLPLVDSRPPPPRDDFPRNKPTNQYGDTWEK